MPAHIFGTCPQGLTISDKEFLAVLLHLERLQELNHAEAGTGQPTNNSEAEAKDAA